jgi:hypothetical protein
MADVNVNEPAADLDVCQWPLLVITIPEGKVSNARVNDVLVRYNQLIREKKSGMPWWWTLANRKN